MDTKNWQWFGGGFVVGVVIIGLVWTVIGQRSSGGVSMQNSAGLTVATSTAPTTTETANSSPTTGDTESTPITATGETLTASDQYAGMTVKVADVTITKPTWVAIKDTNSRVLGARRVDVSTDGTTVSLLRATVAGEVYQAIMYIDDGDKAFDLHKDMLVVGSENAPVSSTFRAQ